MRLMLMTQHGSRGDARYYADQGFVAYLRKPAIANDIVEAISLVLSGNKMNTESSPLITGHQISAKRERNDNEAAKLQLQHCLHKRLLLVEDNAVNQIIARRFLKDLGLSADVAGNGIEALHALQHDEDIAPYDLILMDCQMPEMDGYEATKKIRQGDAGATYRNITIVAMTANAMQGDREKCVAAGMNDYLTKPMNGLALADMLVKWLGEKNSSADESHQLAAPLNSSS